MGATDLSDTHRFAIEIVHIALQEENNHDLYMSELRRICRHSHQPLQANQCGLRKQILRRPVNPGLR